jgi:Fe-S-cluster containining protein
MPWVGSPLRARAWESVLETSAAPVENGVAKTGVPMTRRSFRILDVPDVSEWEAHKHLPRALQPIVYETMPCTDCTGHCCALNVIVSGVEILPIVFTLRARIETLVTASRHDANDKVRRPLPFRLDDAELGSGEFQLQLRRGANGLCSMAFTPGGNVGRCGVWAMRPGNCRIYPFKVEVDDVTFRVGDQLLCPTRWLQHDAMREMAERDARQWLVDLEAEAEVVKRWNRRRKGPRDLRAYLTYLFEEVAPERGFDPRIFDKPVVPRALGKRLW